MIMGTTKKCNREVKKEAIKLNNDKRKKRVSEMWKTIKNFINVTNETNYIPVMSLREWKKLFNQAFKRK